MFLELKEIDLHQKKLNQSFQLLQLMPTVTLTTKDLHTLSPTARMTKRQPPKNKPTLFNKHNKQIFVYLFFKVTAIRDSVTLALSVFLASDSYSYNSHSSSWL